jgi:hypothetical protein
MDYEATVKKLISVFKSPSMTAVDQLKEIETLWQSINNASEHSNGQAFSSSKPVNTKRESPGSQSSRMHLNKKQKLKVSASASSSTLTKFQNDQSTLGDSFKGTESNILKNENSDDIDMSSSNDDNSCKNITNAEDTGGQNDEDDQTTSNIDEYVIEMGLTCDICKCVLLRSSKLIIFVNDEREKDFTMTRGRNGVFTYIHIHPIFPKKADTSRAKQQTC